MKIGSPRLRCTAALVLAVLASCSSLGNGVSRPPWGYRPKWLDELRERTERVPAEETPAEADLATPTQWPVEDVPLGRGVPQDLTDPVEWSFSAKISLEQLGFVMRRLGVSDELLGRVLGKLGVTPFDDGIAPEQLAFVLREIGVESELFDAYLRDLVSTPRKLAVVLGQLGVPPLLFDQILARLGTSAEAVSAALGELGRMPSKLRRDDDAETGRAPAPSSGGAAPAPSAAGAYPTMPVFLGLPPSAGYPVLGAANRFPGVARQAYGMLLPGEQPPTVSRSSDALDALETHNLSDPTGSGTEPHEARIGIEQPGPAVPGPVFGPQAFADAPSALEQMYGGALSAVPDRQLEQFGYEFFRELAAIDEDGPVPGDYVLGAGDNLTVTFTGVINARHDTTVTPSGEIILPEIAVIPVAGQKVQDLEQHIVDYVTRTENRRNFRVAVTMGRLRRFRVKIVGEVVRQGMIEVPARATLLTALAAAGGPKRSGSLRRVQLRRHQDLLETVDLYDFLLTGEDGAFRLLEPDDVIFVPPIGPTIGIAGYVQRPGIYEIEDGVSIGTAIEFAGGLTPFAFRPFAQIEHTDSGRTRRPRDVALDADGLAQVMHDGEMLLIGAVEGRRQPLVELSGEVVRPGSYEFREGMRISDLIDLADGLTVDAFLPQAIVSRTIGEPGSVTIVPGRAALGLTRRVLVVDLRRAIAHDLAHDLELKPLDQLTVRSIEEATVMPTVSVKGAVRHPGEYALVPDLHVSDLIAIAGNLLPDAFYDEAELIRRRYDEQRKLIDVKRYRFDLGKALEHGPDDDPALANHDELFVRRLRTTRVRVRIDGEIRFPGEYVFPEGARISDLIAAAGGASELADIRGAVFTRESVRRLEESRFENFREQTRNAFEGALQQMVKDGGVEESLASKLALTQTEDLVERMSEYQSTGRIVIPFLRDDFPESAVDLLLEDGDALEVPRLQQTVMIVGHVFNPGAIVAEPGQTVRDVIARSGGISEYGDVERIYLIESDGTVRSLAQSAHRLHFGVEVYPGDVVLVPRRTLTRSLGSKLSDLLYVARRLAETALLFDGIGSDVPIDFTSVYQDIGRGLSVGDRTFFVR